ncbi:MAG TPA: hypothetical protein VGL02_24260 [Streptomyces sp.]
MAFGNRGATVVPQNMFQNDHKGLRERIIPFLPAWASSVALWPAAALSHQMWGTDPHALPWATAGLTLLSAGMTALTAKVARGNAGRRAHSIASVAGASAWLTAATIAGPGTHPLLDMWLMGAPALALSWNARRILHVTEKDGDKNTENELFKAVKLAGTKLRGELTVAPNKVTAPLQLPPGELTADDVSNALPRLASALSVPKNAVRVLTDPEHHDRAELVVVPNNMLTTSVDWPGLSAPGGSIMDPLVIGIYEDGDQAQFWLPGDTSDHQNPRNATHGQVMGMNGAGKSHGGKLAWAEILSRTDVNLWVGDPVKGKQTVGKFLDHIHWPAMTKADCEAMIAALPHVITARANYLGEKGLEQWQPGCGLQYLVVWIEEAASLLRDDPDYIVDLVQTARSAGVSLLLSLQRAAYDQMPVSVRSQLGIGWCFGVKKKVDGEFCLSEDTVDAGADPGQWQNKKPGCFYLEAPGVDDDRFTTPGRTFAVKDAAELVAAVDAAGGPARECEFTVRAAGSAYRRGLGPMTSSADQAASAPSAPRSAPSTPAEDVDTAAPEHDPTDDYSDAEEASVDSETVPRNHEPDLDHIDADAELDEEDPELAFDFPKPPISLAQAEQLLADVITELRNVGARTVGPRDIPKSFIEQVRSRPWVSAAMGRMADHGLLVETAEQGRYEFPPATGKAA